MYLAHKQAMVQVYKARVRRTGKVVAVKVQRPGVRESIALDVYIMRYLVGRSEPPASHAVLRMYLHTLRC